MKVFRIGCAVFIVFSIVFTIVFGGKITEKKSIVESENYKAIISIWNIDTFEGGISSRKQFLLKTAIDFEKKNKGVLVMVCSHTVVSAEENIKNGIYPDMISYGNGFMISGESKLKIESEFLGGYLGEGLYAIPWARGGYFLISNPKLVSKVDVNQIEDIVVSKGEYTQPILAMYLEGFMPKNIQVKKCLDAYIKFTENKTPYFLGTQRDIFRLNNRGFSFNAIPLKEFSDLYQYVSITSTDQVKKYYAEEYINYLLTEKVQKRLVEIGLFSLKYNLPYENALKEMDEKMPKYTISPFTERLLLEEISSLVSLATSGDENAKIKIKNMII